MALIKERKSIAPHAYSLIILAILGINGLFTSAAGQDRTGRPSRKHRRAEPKTKSSTPEPMTVILTILSEPAGCQVLLNGEEKGTTNGDGRLEINKLALAVYSVEVRKPGYVSVSRSFQAGTDPPTLQFKLIASLDAEQKTFDGLVSAGQLVGPSSPNALQFVGDLHAKYPDRVEVQKMGDALFQRLMAGARDAIKEAGKLRKANPAQLATGERYAAGAVSLRSGDKEAQVSQAFLAGVRALILWNGDASSSDKSGGDLVSARQNLEKVVSLDPSVTLAQFCLGRVLLLSGDAAAAEPCFLKALQLNPVWVDAHMNLGATYYAEKKYKDSVAEYEKVTGLEPRNAEAFARLGLARSDMGKTKDGVKDLERAIELDNNSGLAHFNLGIVFAESKKKKDRQRAEQEFTLAIEKNQDNRQFKNSDAERRLAELKGNKKK